MIPLFERPFLFLRHGETETNATDRVTGWMDLPLTARGRDQAQAAAERLAALPGPLRPASLWCSPLRRARDTAQPVAGALGLAPHLLAGLKERGWGALEGGPRSALVRDETPPGGEGPETFHARVAAALAEIDGPPPVLIVAHSGVARVLHALIGGDAPYLRPGNGQILLWAPQPRGGWQAQPVDGIGPPRFCHGSVAPG
ncbi:histidine phosphatase family protein [Rhodovulum euryhalinum]|uniref:histidine phosphatase family protein n=1 Tax=Rhodovulum euryhalinum TaxID=35805 RepID=UPI001A9E3A54|nr:histidine phosphatase family protein [Rhodovulum euryhalinum]